MAASLEGCGVREGRVTTYIAALRSLGQKYDKVYSMYIMSGLSQPLPFSPGSAISESSTLPLLQTILYNSCLCSGPLSLQPAHLSNGRAQSILCSSTSHLPFFFSQTTIQ